MNFSYIAWGSGEIVVQAFSALALISLSPEMIGALAVVVLAAILMSSSSAALSGNASAVLVPGPGRVRRAVRDRGAADSGRRDRRGALQRPGAGLARTRPAAGGAAGGDRRPDGGRGRGRIRVRCWAGSLPEWWRRPWARSTIRSACRRPACGCRCAPCSRWRPDAARRLTRRSRTTCACSLENCTYFDVLAGRVSTQQLVREPVMRSLANTAGGFTSVHAGSRGQGALVPVTCEQAWNGNGDPDPVTGVAGLQARIDTEGANRQFQACQSLRGIGLAIDDASRRVAQREAATPDVHGASCGSGVFAKSLQVFGYVPSVRRGVFGRGRDRAHARLCLFTRRPEPAACRVRQAHRRAPARRDLRDRRRTGRDRAAGAARPARGGADRDDAGAADHRAFDVRSARRLPEERNPDGAVAAHVARRSSR